MHERPVSMFYSKLYPSKTISSTPVTCEGSHCLQDLYFTQPFNWVPSITWMTALNTFLYIMDFRLFLIVLTLMPMQIAPKYFLKANLLKLFLLVLTSLAWQADTHMKRQSESEHGEWRQIGWQWGQTDTLRWGPPSSVAHYLCMVTGSHSWNSLAGIYGAMEYRQWGFWCDIIMLWTLVF